jgi:hypothetical protein
MRYGPRGIISTLVSTLFAVVAPPLVCCSRVYANVICREYHPEYWNNSRSCGNGREQGAQNMSHFSKLDLSDEYLKYIR